MKQEIILTKDGGRYYRALTYHWVTTLAILPFALVVILLAVVNPLWFRNDFFGLVERKIIQFGAWRNKIKYRIYLGTDPELWHALKD